MPPGVNARHAMHRHPNAEEWEYVIQGVGIKYVGAKSFFLRAGDLAFVPRNEYHALENASDTETLVTIWGYSGASSLEEAGDLPRTTIAKATDRSRLEIGRPKMQTSDLSGQWQWDERGGSYEIRNCIFLTTRSTFSLVRHFVVIIWALSKRACPPRAKASSIEIGNSVRPSPAFRRTGRVSFRSSGPAKCICCSARTAPANRP